MKKVILDSNQIENYIHKLGYIGLMNGQLWRPVYTSAYSEAKGLVRSWMSDIGLVVKEDAVGNLFGRANPPSKGKFSKKVVMTGSHLDTVRNGGKYDGAAGIICSLVAVSALLKKFRAPLVPVEIVALCGEEGSRFPKAGYLGSRAIVEGLREDDLLCRDEQSITLRQAMINDGLDLNKLDSAKRDDIGVFLELHIEQGPILEYANIDLGIVEKITGLILLEIEVVGRADHAGTTPMDLRLDTLVGVASFLKELPSLALNISKYARATVGVISVKPGMTNVVPEKVKIFIDLREVDEDRLLKLEQVVKERVFKLGNKGYQIKIDRIFYEEPTSMDAGLIKMAEKIALGRNISYLRMNSGAGHDAQVFGHFIPALMLFAPSRGGRSHCPKEYTSPQYLALATEVLIDLLYELAWSESKG